MARICGVGLTPGIIRWVMVGTHSAVASTTTLVHLAVSSSICCVVGLTTLGAGTVVRISLNLSQSALAYWGLGLIGMAIGFTVILAIIGIWSLDVLGPGDSWILWYARLFVSTISGAVPALP